MPHLTIEIDGQHVTSRTLQTSLDLGRSSECGLSFANSFLSRRHLRLHQASEGWRAIDLGSTNGTWIGGSRITDRLLQDGQVIHLGNLALTFHAQTPAPNHNSPRRGDTPQNAKPIAKRGSLNDAEIARILSRPETDSIDEEFTQLPAHESDRRLDRIPAQAASAATRSSSSTPARPQKAGTPSLWEIAMKPTPPSEPQADSRREKSAKAAPQSASDQPGLSKPSLGGRWKDLLVRFDTDIKFKGGMTLGLIALLGLGMFYGLQANGFARPNESRISPAALNAQAETASPASRANALRDLPV